MSPRPASTTLFPYTTLFRSAERLAPEVKVAVAGKDNATHQTRATTPAAPGAWRCPCPRRSEEHTSELQSRGHLVCRLLLEKKKKTQRRRRRKHQRHAL